MSTDKQQELDLPTVKVEQAEPVKERLPQEKNRPMSQISGVRKLKHTNSFTGIVPKYGVETPHTEELGKVQILYLFISSSSNILLTWEIGTNLLP